MIKDEKNIKFKKNIKAEYDNKKTTPLKKTMPEEEIYKKKIMETFNLSSQNAEKVLEKLKQKEKLNKNNEKNRQNKALKQSLMLDNLQHVSYANNHLNEENTKYDENFKKNSKFIKNNVSPEEYVNFNKNKSSNINHENTTINKNENQVDDILLNIIPDYNQQVAIEMTHVNLTFEVSNDRVDTLKETFIRTLKRNKAKKFKLHALNDISFKIYKGEKVGIIGYNGAGKSTLLRVISGIYSPDTGNIKTNGTISPLLGLGAGFNPEYSGRKNIFFNGSILGYDKEYLKQKTNEIIEFTELGDFIDIPIKNYSSGMVSKLAFAIATIMEPDILIIDEILSVGDTKFAKKSGDKLKSLMDRGTTVILVSHSIPQIRSICDKAIWIDQGKVREIGEVNKVCDHYLKDAENATNEQMKNLQLR